MYNMIPLNVQVAKAKKYIYITFIHILILATKSSFKN